MKYAELGREQKPGILHSGIFDQQISDKNGATKAKPAECFESPFKLQCTMESRIAFFPNPHRFLKQVFQDIVFMGYHLPKV